MSGQPTTHPCTFYLDAIVLVIATLSTIGCGSHTPIPINDSSTIGAFDAIYPRQTNPILATTLWPIQPIQTRYTLTHARKQSAGTYEIVKTGHHTFTLTLKNIRQLNLKISDRGAIAITREIYFRQNVTIVYEPALIILPESLTPDQPVTQTVHMTVYHGHTDQIRSQGTCTTTLKLLGDVPLTTRREISDGVADLAKTPAQDRNRPLPNHLAVVQEHRQIDLNLASVQTTLKTGYQLQTGPRVETLDQNVQALGLFTTRNYLRTVIE